MRDLEDVEVELILSDLVVVEKRLERLDKDRKKIRNPDLDREFALLESCKKTLENNVPLRMLDLSAEEEKLIRGFQFLSQKPMLFVLNIGEEDAARLHEIEEEYRRGPLAGRKHTAEGIGTRALNLGHLRVAGVNVVPYRRRNGSACLDHPEAQPGGKGGRSDSQRF